MLLEFSINHKKSSYFKPNAGYEWCIKILVALCYERSKRSAATPFVARLRWCYRVMSLASLQWQL